MPYSSTDFRMNNLSPAVLEAHARIRRAQSEHDVATAVHDYIHGLSVEKLSRLPETCRPPAGAHRDEIVAYNVELARKELMFEGAEEDAALLREMLSVMTEAAQRFAQLSTDVRPPKTPP